MSTTSTNWKYLAPKPGSNYRQLFVKDRGVSARTLYGCFVRDEDRMTMEEIAADWQLPIEVVKEAIAYGDSDPIEWQHDYELDQALMQASGVFDPDNEFHMIRRQIPLEEEIALINGIHEKFHLK